MSLILLVLLVGVSELVNNIGAGLLSAILLAGGAMFWSMNTKLAILTQILNDRASIDLQRDKDMDRRFAEVARDLDLLRLDVEDLKKLVRRG